MLKKTIILKVIRYSVQGLPLLAIIYGAFLPLQRLGQQLLMLALLLWLQVFFIFEIFMDGR